MQKITTQVKFTLEADIVNDFKERCTREGVSMAAVIRGFMQTKQPARGISVKMSTRPLRRKAISNIIKVINEIMRSEEAYRDKIPEQFEVRIEDADHACEQMADAIAALGEAF